jgi:hypothetical protein
MKKLVLTTVSALAMTVGAFAQGTVNWQTLSPAAITVQTNSTQISPLFGGASAVGGAVGYTGLATSGYYYELLYTSYTVGGPAATIPTLASLLSWNDTGLVANNSTASAGKLVAANANAGATVPWNAGVTDSIVLVGWSANLGTTWGTVSNLLATTTSFAAGSFLGVSATGYLTSFASGTSPGATVFNTAATPQGLPINSINTQLYLLPSAAPVPEPATMALMGLGGLSLLLFRRSRKS